MQKAKYKLAPMIEIFEVHFRWQKYVDWAFSERDNFKGQFFKRKARRQLHA
jgi:hypothetical protein